MSQNKINKWDGQYRHYCVRGADHGIFDVETQCGLTIDIYGSDWSCSWELDKVDCPQCIQCYTRTKNDVAFILAAFDWRRADKAVSKIEDVAQEAFDTPDEFDDTKRKQIYIMRDKRDSLLTKFLTLLDSLQQEKER